MRIYYLDDITKYKDYLDLDEETYIFVKNLTYTGINIYKEMAGEICGLRLYIAHKILSMLVD